MTTGQCMSMTEGGRGSKPLSPAALVSVWLALAALFLNIGLPVFSSGAQGLTRMEICSQGETRAIWLDRNGKQVPDPARAKDECCKACVHHCSMALGLALSAIHAPGFMTVQFVALSQTVLGALAMSTNSRDPPQG